MNVETSFFEEAARISESCMNKYDECISRAEAEFLKLNEAWSDPQYEIAKERFNECKKYITVMKEVLERMKTDFNKDAILTADTANRIKGLWG